MEPPGTVVGPASGRSGIKWRPVPGGAAIGRKERTWDSRSTSRHHRVVDSRRSPILRRSLDRRLRSRCSSRCTKQGGRNNNGRITTRHQGGGHKRQYRKIDFKRNKDGIPAKVATIEYDPNRSARIALLHYADGEKRYILAPQKLTVGDTVMSGVGADIKPGNALPLENIPTGTVVHAIELQPGRGAAMARSAGTSAQLMAKEGPNAILRMPSSEMRMVPLDVPRDRRRRRQRRA